MVGYKLGIVGVRMVRWLEAEVFWSNNFRIYLYGKPTYVAEYLIILINGKW